MWGGSCGVSPPSGSPPPSRDATCGQMSSRDGPRAPASPPAAGTTWGATCQREDLFPFCHSASKTLAGPEMLQVSNLPVCDGHFHQLFTDTLQIRGFPPKTFNVDLFLWKAERARASSRRHGSLGHGRGSSVGAWVTWVPGPPGRGPSPLPPTSGSSATRGPWHPPRGPPPGPGTCTAPSRLLPRYPSPLQECRGCVPPQDPSAPQGCHSRRPCRIQSRRPAPRP